MLSAESKKNAYYFDYTTKTPDQPKVRKVLSSNPSQLQSNAIPSISVDKILIID
jgi:hypothetical protein